jgi:hypothetical protein
MKLFYAGIGNYSIGSNQRWLWVVLLLSYVHATSETSTTGSRTHLQAELNDLVSSAKDALAAMGPVITSSDDENNSTDEYTEDDDFVRVLQDQVWSLTTTVKELTTQYQEIIDLYIQQSALIDEVNVFQMKRFIKKLKWLLYHANEFQQVQSTFLDAISQVRLRLTK